MKKQERKSVENTRRSIKNRKSKMLSAQPKPQQEIRNIREDRVYLSCVMLHIRTGIVFVIVLCLDLVTKYFFYDRSIGSETLLLSPHFNTGIAWSLPVPLWLVLLLTILVL